MWRAVQKLYRSERGAVAPTIALSLTGLIAAGGLAFDYARLVSLDTELQDAADQAALAAASQLDGTDGSMQRATAAAQSLLTNRTLMANDQNASRTSVTIPVVAFYATVADAEADANPITNTANFAQAHYTRVAVDARRANFALTPIVGAFTSGDLHAEAVAGMKSAVCKVPPLMMCNPRPGTTFDADAMKGVGLQATGHGNDRSGTGGTNTGWGPGDFGFLDVGAGQNSDLEKALAFQDLSLKCYFTDSGQVTTGNPQGAYDAINTRFDIYDFSAGNGTTLAPCFSGACPSAANVVKDVVKNNTNTNGNACKLSNSGWQLPTNQFAPHSYTLGSGGLTQMDTNTIDAMGLPRDNCHYTSFGKACSTISGESHLGNGEWARYDYFNKYHAGALPPNASTITRYETYLWEQAAAGRIPYGTAAGGGLNQYGAPVCSSGTVHPGTDRRVLSLAVVENCAQLSGSSRSIVVSQWADVFLVEPTLDARANGSLKDSIYIEIIGRTHGAGTGLEAAQTIRRDVPYLVK
jgi:Flp pilus assembly protein TadG